MSVEARDVVGMTAEHVTPIEIWSILMAPGRLTAASGPDAGRAARPTPTSATVPTKTRFFGSTVRSCAAGWSPREGTSGSHSSAVSRRIADGLIYTDAIDNSAGVDCSDHEVNIKILLGDVVAAGGLPADERNGLLFEMTDEVAVLVLENNRAQTLGLMIARRQALPMANVHARYLDQLEAEHWLDRALEFLPTDRQIAERQSSGRGLLTPELAVAMAYTKNADVADILLTDLPDDPALESDLVGYFPGPLRERFPEAIRNHRLRRGSSSPSWLTRWSTCRESRTTTA